MAQSTATKLAIAKPTRPSGDSPAAPARPRKSESKKVEPKRFRRRDYLDRRTRYFRIVVRNKFDNGIAWVIQCKPTSSARVYAAALNRRGSDYRAELEPVKLPPLPERLTDPKARTKAPRPTWGNQQDKK